MSEPPSGGGPDTVDHILLVEHLCDRFENALRAGRRAAVEVFLREEGIDPVFAPSELLRELAKLEAEYADATASQPGGAAGADSRAAPGSRPGLPVIPGYEILEEICRGMGVVYKARQLNGPRLVALKVIGSCKHASPAERERFRTEAAAIARIAHPHVVQVFEPGEHDGVPYFSMEYCPGGDLAQKLAGNPMPPVEAAALVEKLALGVQAAHEKGVVHRDLKPANVLLAADGTPKVTDFGLAKLTDAAGAATGTGAVLGTPSYMAPEQASGHAKEAGPPADVYALGAVLYECLTGRPPFKGMSVADTLVQVKTQEPVAVRDLVPGVPPDLEAVCLKCLEKDPANRYASAADLVADLRNFLEHRPTLARPLGTLGKLRRWVRRNRGLAGALGAVAAALLLGTAVAVAFALDADSARKIAKSREDDANDASAQLRERVDQLRLEAYPNDIRLAFEGWRVGDLAGARELLDRCLPKEGQTDLRGFEWYYLDACLRDTERVLARHDAALLTADVSRDGKLVASGDASGLVKVTDLETGREVHSFRYSINEVTCVRFSPNGESLATAGQDGTIRLWNVQDWSEARCFREHIGTVTCIAWAPDSTQIASGGRDYFLKTWHVPCGVRLLNIKHPDVLRCVAWSGRDFISTGCKGPDNTDRLWDADNGKLHRQFKSPDRDALAQAFSPGVGSLHASGGYSRLLRMTVPATGTGHCTLRSTGYVWSLAFNPDIRHIVAGQDGRIQVWDTFYVDRETFPIRTRELTGTVRAVAFTRDGRALITAVEAPREGPTKAPSEVRVCSAEDILGYSRHEYPGTEVAVAPSSNSVAVREVDNGVFIGGFPAWRPRQSLGIFRQWDTRLVFTPQGDELLTTDAGSQRVRARTVATASVRGVVLDGKRPAVLAVSYDGEWVAGLTAQGEIVVTRLATGERVKTLRCSGCSDTSRLALTFSGDCTTLAAVANHDVKVWRTGSWEQLAEWSEDRELRAVSLSPDGRVLATAGREKGVVLWDVSSGTQLSRLRGHEGAVTQVQFSPDGRTLATAGEDQSVRLWHVPTRRELFTLFRHVWPVHWVQFGPNNRLLVSGRSSGRDKCDVLVFPPVDRPAPPPG